MLLATPGQRSDDLLLTQSELIGKVEGESPENMQRSLALLRKALAALKAGKDLSALEKDFSACAPECTGGAPAKDAIARMATPWFRYFANYDPTPTLKLVKCPVLALNGSLDLQVPASLNLPLIKKALEAGKRPHTIYEELSGVNHVLQKAKTGAVSKYSKLPKEIDPRVPTRIIGWIRGLGAIAGN